MFLFLFELIAIFVHVVCPIMPVQTKFQIRTIFIPDILETSQFHPKKLRFNRIIGQTTWTNIAVNSCCFWTELTGFKNAGDGNGTNLKFGVN
ncbi:hypothetical protein Hanom_Chr16g01498191 [Helianthus anomalus]